MNNKYRYGLSLVELLVAMSILGILLATLNAFFISNQRVTGQQMKLSEVNAAARQSLLRINDVVSQAGYIFPANQVLSVGGRNFTTGATTLAVLLPAGASSVYCQATTQRYCGYLYTIEPRTNYTAILGNRTDTTGFALVEYKTNGATLTWTRGQNPAVSTRTWVGTQVGILTDSVNSATTNLGGTGNLELVDSSRVTNFESSTFTFKDVGVGTTGNPAIATALIQSATSTVVVTYRYRGQEISATQTSHGFGRAIPRSTLPNLN
jgi:prepilin-type N-terminal cleavage/methylation domain-containing protein